MFLDIIYWYHHIYIYIYIYNEIITHNFLTKTIEVNVENI